jgi:protocatechuate 3,4-dioxygenase, alpha subunit
MTMNAQDKVVGSQTIGPFWHNGLKWAQGNRSIFASGNDAITLFGQVYDGDGQPMTDAMLEFYVGGKSGAFSGEMGSDGRGVGFVRTPTDHQGIYRIHIAAPKENGFLHVMIFARGLLTHVYTRVFFADSAADVVGDSAFDAANAAGRGDTLLASRTSGNAFVWDIRLQGEKETVFFARD